MNDRNFPNGKVEMQWSYPGRPAPHYSLDLHTSAANMIAWLVRHRPRYLLTFPSVAQELASHPDARRLTELGLKGVVAISEVVSDDASDLVRKSFGCEFAQIYGCTEMGAIALQSSDDGTLLVCDESVLVELIDDDHQPVEPGETGRVILTSLYNFATPFIRYEVGDYATSADGVSPSGRAFTRLQRIEGRQRNALVTGGMGGLGEGVIALIGGVAIFAVPSERLFHPRLEANLRSEVDSVRACHIHEALAVAGVDRQ